LKAALSLIDVKILDHLIVAEQVFSFSAAGIL
jgi:DNA repair protein RadC